MPMLLYLHGFNSSPQSKKAMETRDWCADHAPELTFVCPALPPFAESAMGILRSLIERQLPEPVYLIGSSMGGFFATCLAEQYNLRAVLINPAVSPGRGLHSWLGENSNYHTGETWIFEPRHIDQYSALDPDEIRYKNNYKVLLQTGDEVLDYRDAQRRYQGADISIEQQGDHSFINYHQHLESIIQFLMSTPAANNPIDPVSR
ncbi:MAG: YqiA/YcfP family alpha/beta fold hydrolase [Porticoccaceae bacterium]